MGLSDLGYTAGGYYFEVCNATSGYVEDGAFLSNGVTVSF
jgi:hypothetical protein